MRYYPINLDLAGRRCAVVGGGSVAERKVLSLLEAGARVVVISPAVSPLLARLAQAGKIRHQHQPWTPGDLTDFVLVILATNNPEVNRLAAGEARQHGSLVNVVDVPDLCDFTIPAQVQRGDLLLTVSTGGASPAFARRLREELEELYGDEYGVYLELLAELRQEMKERLATPAARECFWRQTLDRSVLDLLRQGKIEAAKERICDAVSGAGAQS